MNKTESASACDKHTYDGDYDPVNEGMPKLDLGTKPVSFFEFWPAWFFYIPVGFYWVYLSIKYRSFGLPMTVNPNILLSGMVGESKIGILADAGPLAQSYILPFSVGERSSVAEGEQALHNCDESLAEQVENDLKQASALGVELPFVAKPDLGCRGAGVQVIRSDDELRQYLKSFPCQRQYMLQRLAPYAAEAGVFYQRYPNENTGRLSSITLKYMPYVQGDGSRTLASLILNDSRAKLLRDVYFEKNQDRLSWIPPKGEWVTLAFAGSHCRGSIFRDGNAFISAALTAKIDEIMQDFPDFHYGRLDIKFKDIESLMRGEDFVIIEVNGASSEATHIWDSRGRLRDAFATLLGQYRTLFEMGDLMRARGYKVPSIATMIKVWIRELRQGSNYPETS